MEIRFPGACAPTRRLSRILFSAAQDDATVAALTDHATQRDWQAFLSSMSGYPEPQGDGCLSERKG
jgi:hypothetical protein